MSRRTILHARVVTGSGGGPDKTILTSPRYLETLGYSALCAYLRHPQDPGFAELERRAREKGADLRAIDDYGPFDWRVLGRLRSVCEQYRPAIWHGHDYKSNLLGLLLRRSRPMKLVTTVHGWVQRTWKTPLYYAIDRFALRRYEAVLCVSQDLHDRCLAAGVPASRCRLLPNAIDTEEFRRRRPREAAKEALGLDPSRLVIGAVGRLSAEKGFGRLIEAVRRLVATDLDVALWIAGEGDHRPQLERLIGNSGVADRIRLLGFQSDLSTFYEALDVFALSSVREGLPNVLLEAMALETPVLCTRVAGIPSLVRDGVNGLLVEPGSTAALVEGLRQLLREPDLGTRLGQAARRTIEESFDFRDRMRTVRSVYDQVLASEDGRSPGR